MKFFIAVAFLCAFWSDSFAQTSPKFNDTTLLKPVEVDAIRASDKTPVAKTTLTRIEIQKNNIGHDLPFILNQTPSVIVNSDAGNGIGYTGIRIRGSDASRINVTLNGIPYNDAESQGTFFVDLPDIASSAGSIQIQRGVGTSSNGSGSFGGSINVSTNDLVTKRNLQIMSNAGSFSSFRNTLLFNSGIYKKHLTTDIRLSNITSKGYIDRASSKLRSYYISNAYVDDKNSIRLNIFSGKEKTYQAWNGIDEETLIRNRKYNSAGTEKAGDPYHNEVDDYLQTHYQLFYNRKIDNNWKANIGLFLTTGKGFYEQYKAAELLSSYGLPDYDTISNTDLVRRLWLENKFYGSIFSLQYEKDKTNFTVGGNVTRYDGNHFGEIIAAAVQKAIPPNYKWYDLDAHKTDMSIYTKWLQKISPKISTFLDLQARMVEYEIYGFRNNPDIKMKNTYRFFNPKIGLRYTFNQASAFLSYARGAKEPNRDDFETGLNQKPTAEKLNDFEAGFEFRNKATSFLANVYYMQYKDQLMLTGKVNDVGAYTRTNIDHSFRTGIELQASTRINKYLNLSGNMAFSINKIKNFVEYLDDYDNGGQKSNFYKSTNIAFSPAVVGSSSINLLPFKNAEVNLISKYVSRQYLDNTSDNSRSLRAYYLQDIRLNYLVNFNKKQHISLFVQANNVFNKKYEPNGYSFSYIYENAITTENYYLPMATFNIMTGVNIKL